MEWAYGVTTVPSRVTDGQLERTLASLAAAGFERPRLFVDGLEGVASDSPHWITSPKGLEKTVRRPAVGPFGNWYLALLELYIRQPHAALYALFQDDLLAVRNLRPYLERSWPCGPPGAGYLNLYTVHSNLWAKGGGPDGWFPSLQHGQGALALVFDREGVLYLLGHPHLVFKPAAAHKPTRSIDGAVIEAMKQGGRKEWVHCPSLVQHTGWLTAIQRPPNEPTNLLNTPDGQRWPDGHQSPVFPGEGWDALAEMAAKGEGGSV